MTQRNRIDTRWIDSNGYRSLSGQAYKYVLHINGEELAKYTQKGGALAEARYQVGARNLYPKSAPLREVEVVWIGNPDTYAVYSWTAPEAS